MKKILFILIDFNSLDSTKAFISSLLNASPELSGYAVEVYIVANGCFPEDAEIQFAEQCAHKFALKILKMNRNLGYFGPIEILKKEILENETDFSKVIYCNPDITIEDHFFEELAKDLGNDCCITAPAIIDPRTHQDQNPFLEEKPPKGKYIVAWLLTKWLVVYFIYEFFYQIMKGRKNPPRKPGQPRTIFAPHGAFIIFNEVDFFLDLPKHRSFLYGEEFTIAEAARSKGKIVRYNESIKVFHSGSVSISLAGLNRKRAWSLESIENILEDFYE